MLVATTRVHSVRAFHLHAVAADHSARLTAATSAATIALVNVPVAAGRDPAILWKAFALGVPSVALVVTATPWGLHPAVGLGCVDAAPSRQGSDGGGADAVPPPHCSPSGWDTRARR